MKKMKKVTAAVSALALAISLNTVYPTVTHAAVPSSSANSTIFGPNVYVFDPAMPKADIESVTSAVYGEQEQNEFGDARYALLFKPGSYNVNMNVGFNTSVAGLGQNPDDVAITGALNVDAKWDNGNATRNFWRSIENLKIAPTDPDSTVRFAVSQAAPMRRVHVVSKDMHLFDFTPSWGAGWASGGFLADSKIDADVTPASQQQWFARNSEWNKWSNGVWNMVFVGDKNAPSGEFPDPPYTVIDKTPVIKEKPYLYIDNEDKYQVFVPSLQTDTEGASWANGPTPGQSISIDDFYIAKPDTTSAAITEALNAGKNLFFTPGIYHLSDTIHISRPNTVVYGIGLPTLIPDNGQDVIVVDDVDGVNVSGLVIEAGAETSSTLLKVGEPGSTMDHSANPISLSDLFFRTGGHVNGSNDTALEINSNDVIGDHFWIWRADHGAGAAWTSNISKNGLIVNGDDVTIYGLFNEHHNEYQTIWNGNGGRLYFYQSEIPYDVPDQESWMSNDGTVNGYASYKIGDDVTSHEAWGLGIYSYFRDAAVKLENAIEAPANPGIQLHHLTTIWLNGTAGSEITHIVNGNGGSVTSSSNMRQTMKEFVGGDAEAPTVPTGLTATAVSSSQINLSWTASTDNVGVEGYDIYRNNTLVGSTLSTTYNNTGLKASTSYTYKIVAKDGSGNRSAASQTATAATTDISSGALDRTGWAAESSPTSGDAPSNMFDGDNDTRWSAGIAMANGQYIIVDMKTAADITKIVTESSGSDYAKSYEVYVSADGMDWGSSVASGNGTSGAMNIDVTASAVRFIKIVQTGTSDFWWSIKELNVYGTYLNTQVDTTAPETAIADKPALVSNDNTPTFSFTSSEEGSTFECSLDNSGEYYTICASPVTFPKLADGSHTLYVRAADIFGNTDDTPAEYTWVIDTVKPIITLNGDPVVQLEQGTAYTELGASATDNHDGDLTGQIIVTGTVDTAVAGDYTIQYTVSDAAGNAAVLVSRTVRVLEPVVTEGPSTTITGAPNAVTNNSSASFSFTSNQENATFEYSLDDGEWTAAAAPLALTELADGTHTIQVHAVNADNVVGDAASYTWTIDTVKPVITLTGAADIQITKGSAYVDQGATAADNRQGVLEVFVTGDVVNANTVGVYTILYNASDEAGNAADEVSRIVRVAAPAPAPVTSAPPLSSDANLKSINVTANGQAISLSPAFSAATTAYTVETEAAQVDVSAAASDAKARVGLKVNGQVPASQSSVSLSLGTNVLEWTVAAENGNTKTYKVTITRTAVPLPAFTDLAGHWAEQLIKQAAEKKIVTGYTDGTFRPDHTVTRSEFVVMLVNALQLQSTGKEVAFDDGAGIPAWAADAVAVAVNAGIINGYADGTFRPDATITRAEMAVMIARALQLSGEATGNAGFSDDAAIPQWSKDAVDALKQEGLINGRGGNLFVPNGTATRAEAAVLLLRLLEQ